MRLKPSEKSAQQLQHIMSLLDSNNPAYTLQKMITAFELSLTKSLSKEKTK
jgi:hypothetical protein